MRNPHVSLVMAAGLLTGGCATEATPSTSDRQADIEAVRAVIEQEVATALAGDAEGFIAQFTADAMVMPPDEADARGEAFRDFARGFFSQLDVEAASLLDDDVVVDGDLAFQRYEFAWTITPADGGETVNEVIKGIHILRRQADGSWKISHDIWNSNSPPAGM